jgi:hypothetical protein
MSFSTNQLVAGLNYAIQTFQTKEPIDQINVAHKTLDWLVSNKEESIYGNGSFKEPVYVANNSNAQGYFGADQVTFNERDPARWTDFSWYNVHDGFWFDEDRLLAAGISIDDSGNAGTPSGAEKAQLIDLLKQSYRTLKNSMQEYLAYETLRDGSQSTKSCPGLGLLVASNPATGVVGGIDGATSSYWRNNANIGITAANVITQMETTYKACMRYGGMLPKFIPCGQAFYDNYVAQATSAVQRHMAVMGKGGATMDPSVDAVNFHGIPLIWDPTFESLDALVGGSTNTKTALFLNPEAIKLRPVKGEWMRKRKPQSLPDRYVYYFGQTAKYGMTTSKRNALARLTIA